MPAVHMYEPDAVYPLLHVGVHERPLASVAEHVPASPLVTAADASQGVDVGARVSSGAMQTAVLVVSVPAAHVLVPISVYPLLHVGVHELPLARLDVHVPASPFIGAVAASHALALHAAVLVVNVPAEHVLVPDTVYPLLHVGVHELPLASVAVHVPASPFVGAAEASHGQGALAHPE